MTKPDPDQLGELLSAYVDRELDAAQTAQVERLLCEDESARRQLAALRRTVNAVASLPRHPAPASIATDVQAMLERSALLGDAPPGRPHAHPARVSWTARLSMAAMLAIVFVGGWWFVKERSLQLAPQPSSATRAIQSPASPVLPVGAEVERPAMVPSRALTVDDKLAAGADSASLRSHAFAAEAVRMQINVRDFAEQNELGSRLTRHLAGQRVTDLAKEAPPSPDLRRQAFFLKGSAGVNYAPTDQTQILVRATPQQIDEVLAEVERAARSAGSANLQVGPLNVRGVDRSRKVVQAMGQQPPAVATDMSSKSADAKTQAPPADPGLAWLEILKQIAPELSKDGHQAREAEKGADSRALKPEEEPGRGNARAGGQPQIPPAGPGLVERNLADLKKAADADAQFGQPAADPYLTIVIELVPATTPAPAKTQGSSK